MGDYFNLPISMQDANRWLVWKIFKNPDPTKKDKKMPFYVSGIARNGEMGSAEDVAQLVSIDIAIKTLETGKYSGLGFALGTDETGHYWQGIDLDHLSDHPENHYLKDDLIGMTYCETSPNGDGIHAIGYGRKFPPIGSTTDGLEAYSTGRFFTVTADDLSIHDPIDLHDFVENVLRPRRMAKSIQLPTSQFDNPFPEQISPEQIADLRSAINIFDANDRGVWSDNAQRLIKLGDIGKEIWLTWSQQSLDKYDPKDAIRVWKSAKGDRTGYKAIFDEAQKRGWINPRSKATQNAFNDGVNKEASSPIRTWAELAGPFSEHVVPAFPLSVLPESFQHFCIEKSAQSGFDVGGYAYASLITAGNMVDHRIKMDVGAFSVHAFQWATINAGSGKGKSPVVNEATKISREIDNNTVKKSQISLAEWNDICKALPKAEHPPRPVWRQRNALDTTTEALAQLLCENPDGVTIHADELSEFIGRMDAYKSAGGADRAIYLRSYDGGQVTINRASKNPIIVENFSVGILAGVQPEKLAQMFKKSGAGSSSDGLFQRFLPYCLRPASKCDYNVQMSTFTETNFEYVFYTIHKWTEEKVITNASLDTEGRQLMQSYHNDIRILTERTPSQRFAEHLDKYPGMLGRMTFALHCIQCAADGQYSAMVASKTLLKALQVMKVMYRHSEATYAVLDSESGDVLRLVVSAAEAILTKNWALFKRGDLTRNATHWQGAEAFQAEGAIDFLIELGWIADVTPAQVAGKKGRRSDGVFQTNPLVHEQFSDHATRIKQNRAARYSAIQQITDIKLN